MERTTILALAMMVASLLAVPGSARASSDPDRCQRAVLDEVGRFLDRRVKVLQRCEDAKAKGSLGPATDCTADPETRERLDDAAARLRAGIDRWCGGANKMCEASGDDDLDYAALFGMTQCPNFEDGTCTQAIEPNSCLGLRECLVCMGESVADPFVTWLYGDLASAVFGAQDAAGREVNRCQRTVGREAARFALKKAQTLTRCWDARYKGRHGEVCPDLDADPSAGKDAVKAAERIASAESKKIKRLCRACGGRDRACDDPVLAVNPGTAPFGNSQGGDDLPLTSIFADVPDCPAVVAPPRSDRPAVDCSALNPLTTVADLVYCVDCIAEYRVDCLDGVRVTNNFGPYAAVAGECNSSTPPPPFILEVIDTNGDGGGNILRNPNGVAVDDSGNIYVGGRGTNNAFRISSAGVVTEIIDATGDGLGNTLSETRELAAGPDGSVYVAASGSDNVFKVAPGGAISEIIDASGDGSGNNLDHPWGIAVDTSGNVYVPGRFSNNAFRITPAGVVTEIIDSTGDGAGNSLGGPRDVAVDPSGNAYVAGYGSNNVFKITPGGVVTEIIDATGDGLGNTLNGAISVAADAAENVYVAGNNSNNAFKITAGGVVTEIIDSSGDGLGNTVAFVDGIAVDDSGNAYLVSSGPSSGFKITPGGVITNIIDSAGDGTNPLSNPVEIAVDGGGDAYVIGNGSHNAFKIFLP